VASDGEGVIVYIDSQFYMLMLTNPADVINFSIGGHISFDVTGGGSISYGVVKFIDLGLLARIVFSLLSGSTDAFFGGNLLQPNKAFDTSIAPAAGGQAFGVINGAIAVPNLFAVYATVSKGSFVSQRVPTAARNSTDDQIGDLSNTKSYVDDTNAEIDTAGGLGFVYAIESPNVIITPNLTTPFFKAMDFTTEGGFVGTISDVFGGDVYLQVNNLGFY